MQEALARLGHLLVHATLGLVTEPIGVGKSAILKRFLHELLRNRYETVYCHLAYLSSNALLKTIVAQLGEQPMRGK